MCVDRLFMYVFCNQGRALSFYIPDDAFVGSHSVHMRLFISQFFG